jgi:hypothetical protein
LTVPKVSLVRALLQDDSEPGLTLSTPRTYLLSATVDF